MRRANLTVVNVGRSRSAPEAFVSAAPGPRPWLTLLKWTGLGVLISLVITGAVALGLQRLDHLFGPAGHAPSAAVSTAAPLETPPPQHKATPVEVQGPTYVGAAADMNAVTESPSSGPDFTAEKIAAEEALRARLPETEGLIYRDVKTNLSTVDGQPTVDFCGEVNSLDPSGAYVGFQKFIAARDDARTERSAAPGDFIQAWGRRCSGSEGPKIWN